jgi:macrocin-O-methyltransferase TylF-like protien
MPTCENAITEQEEASSREALASDLYLDLLKKVLTDSIFHAEPNLETQSETSYIQSFIQHCIKGRALTMVPAARLNNVQRCLEDVIKNEVPGDVIETGVWRGGTAIFIKAILRAYNADDRNVWVADSFEGLPKPDASQFPVEAQAHDSKIMQDVYHHFAVNLEDVKQNFDRFGLLDDGVKFLKGWFKDTLPSAPITQLAVARLDGDYYESTMDSLVNLYHKVSPGGFVIIDDYGQDDWTYCRKAVDEFRTERGITEPMIRVDSTCHFWQKRV